MTKDDFVLLTIVLVCIAVVVGYSIGLHDGLTTACSVK